MPSGLIKRTKNFMRSLFLPVMHEIKTWKIVIGFFIISVFYILGSFLFGIFCSSIPICSFSNGLGRTPLNLLFVLFTFVPIWIGVWVAMKFIHHIPMKVLFSPSGKLDLPLLFKAFSIMLSSALGYEIVDHFILPASSWTESYYDPLNQRIAEYESRWIGLPDAESVIAEARHEISIFNQFSQYFSYAFFVMQK